MVILRIPQPVLRLNADMKFWVTFCAAVLVLQSARAGGLPPESFEGTVWGGIMGGLAGADCRHGFSGEGAAIGAGIGFALGTIAGESRRAAERSYYYAPPVAYAPVSYGYVGSSYVVQSPVPAAPALAPSSSRRIPDAPRVPDAPTF